MDRYQQMEELHRHWAPPPALAASTPRTVVLAGGGVAVVVLAGLLFVGAVAAIVGLETVARNQAEDRRQLREQGREAEATITRHWREGNKENRPMVAYEFDWEGRTYSGRTHLPLRVWKTLDAGSPFAVRFLPADPARNRSRDWEPSVLPVWFPFLVGALLAAIGMLLVYLVRRQTNLLREGRPAPGVVTRYSQAPHNKKNVHYEFRLLSGGIAKRKSGPTRRVLPAIGATVCVVYDRDNPRHSALYPMDLARLA